MAIRYSAQVGRNEPLHFIYALAHSVGRNLSFVAHHDVFTAQVKRGQSAHVALAGLINNDDVKLSLSGIEALIHSVERHNSDRHRASRIG
jgi:hypothetical protein